MGSCSTVVAIFRTAGGPFLVCTPNRGVVRGDAMLTDGDGSVTLFDVERAMNQRPFPRRPQVLNGPICRVRVAWSRRQSVTAIETKGEFLQHTQHETVQITKAVIKKNYVISIR